MQRLFPLLFLFLLACNNKAEDKTTKTDTSTVGTNTDVVINRTLVGTWKPVQVDIARMNEAERKELMDSATIQFTSDGQIHTTMKERRNSGTYMYSEQDSKLTTRIDNREEKFNIAWDSELLRMTNEEGTVVMKRR